MPRIPRSGLLRRVSMRPVLASLVGPMFITHGQNMTLNLLIEGLMLKKASKGLIGLSSFNTSLIGRHAWTFHACSSAIVINS